MNLDLGIFKRLNSKQNSFAFDRLTGLANSEYFTDLANEIIGEHNKENQVEGRNSTPLTFLYFNVENFKIFNSEYGYEAGDYFLRELAHLIEEICVGDLVGRTSNDHFLVLTGQRENEERIIQIHEKAHEIQKDAKMEVCAGIYEYEEGVSVTQAHDMAKIACDTIKGDYSRIWCYYDDQIRNRLSREKYILDNIDVAVEKEYLEVYYQPIVRVFSNKICAVESLIRWNDPELGFLTPDEFIPILERRRLIHKVDQYVLNRVCRDQNRSRSLGETVVPASVNLSRLDFQLVDVYELVSNTVREYGIDPKTIHIEITESALDEEEDKLRETMSKLHQAGFEIWLDDFGSKYSTLNSLQNFQFDLLKIDMKFFENFETNENARTIITAITDMSKRLHMRVLAEGIETLEQIQFLKKIGCDKAQGYYFSRPCPLDVFYGLDLKRENMQEEAYYTSIGEVNFLSPIPLNNTQVDSENMYNLVPTAIVQNSSNHLEYLYANDGFLECLRSMGVGSLAQSEGNINDDSGKLQTRLQGLTQKCHETKNMESVNFLFHGFHINIRAREIAYNEGVQALFVTMMNLSTMENVRKIDQLETSLNFLYSMYERVDILSPADDVIENIYLSSEYYQTNFSGKTLEQGILEYGRTDVAAEDLAVFLEFYDMDTIEERFSRKQKNYIVQPLRTLTHKNGVRRQLYILIRIQIEADVKYLSCVRDIVKAGDEERDRSLELARDGEPYWHHLLCDEFKASIFQWDQKTGAAYASGRAYQYTLSQDSLDDILENRVSLDGVYGDDIPIAYDFFVKSKSGIPRAEATLRLKMLDGTYRWSRVIGLFQYDSDGQPERTTGIILDIEQQQTDLKQARFMNQMPAALGVFEVLNGKPRQLYMNDEYYRLVEDDREKRRQYNDTSFITSIHPDNRRELLQTMDRVIHGGEETCSQICQVRTGLGDYKWIRFSARVARREENYMLVYSTYAALEGVVHEVS